MPTKAILFLMILSLLSSCGDEGETPIDPSQLTSSDISITETESTRPVTLDLFLSTPQADDVVISFETKDGTAEADEDYQSSSGAVVFAAGDMRESITINLVGDEDYEEEESFYVSLVPQSENVEITTELITITIEDNDEPPGNELVIPSSGYQSPTSYDGWNLVWQRRI